MKNIYTRVDLIATILLELKSRELYGLHYIDLDYFVYVI